MIGVARPGRVGTDPRAAVVAGAVVLLEALLLLVLAGLVPKATGAEAETPSAVAVLVVVGLGALVAYGQGESDLSGPKRWLLGVAVSVVVLQIVSRVDLSETARVWSLGWVADATDPDSGAWRGSERFDHTLSVAMLALAWFRGVALGGRDLEERSLTPLLPAAVGIFGLGFLVGDAAGTIDTVRIAALAFLAVGLVAVAFRNARRLTTDGEIGAMGMTFVSTFGAMTAIAIIFMLIVTLLVAAVGGTGVAEPVTDALGVVLRAVVEASAWVVWILFWPVRELASGGMPIDSAQDCVIDGTGELECSAGTDTGAGLGMEDSEGDSSVGTAIFRIFAGIALVLFVTVLAALLFRRVWRRHRETDEERESLWGEADPLGDLWQGLRSLGRRLRRPRRAAAEPGIGGLYLEMLADAASRGTLRPPARTPLQFAPALDRLYRSALPGEISRRFCDLRYGGQDAAAAEVSRLRTSWETLASDRPG